MFYVVTKGNYSDYHIIGVTTDRGVAEQIVNRFSGDAYWDQARIEEYPDGSVVLKPAWNVSFNRGGAVVYCEPCNSEYEYEYIGKVLELGGGYDYIIRCCVSADNKEAAVKIAAEKRAMYLAEKNGL